MTNSKRYERQYFLQALQALNRFYSLRDLEKLLGVPFQNLWKYVNMLSIPEEKTVEKSLQKMKEANLIEKALQKALEKVKGNVWRLPRNVGFLKLYAFIAKELLGDVNIEYVLGMSEYSSPLATALALSLDSNVCIVKSHASYEDFTAVTWYRSGLRRGIRFLALPRECMQEG